MNTYYDKMARFQRPPPEKDLILKTRTFNNACKRKVIEDSCYAGCRVLDVACGRGGDIHKINATGASLYVGMDISEASLDEARNRSRVYKHRTIAMHFVHSDMLNGDAFKAHIFDVYGTFDIVMCNFAIHYASNIDALNVFFYNCKSVMKKDARLIVCTCSFDTLRNMKRNESSTGSFEFRFDGETELKPFEKYEFSMDQAVAFHTEYAIRREDLEACAVKNNLVLESQRLFNEIDTSATDLALRDLYCFFTFKAPHACSP